ncbi:MAG: aryl-sulfate sulfotransferase [Bacteroidales bacterium]
MQKIRINTCFLIFVLIAGWTKTTAQVTYISPCNGSEYNNPKTNIIIKFNQPVSPENNINSCFKIYGKNYWPYEFETKLVDNNKTLIINSLAGFRPGDSIHIMLIHALKLENTDFSELNLKFNVSKNLNIEPITTYPESLSNERISKSIPANYPEIHIGVNNNPSEGKIFLYNVSSLASDNNRYLSIIDNSGVPVFWKQENNVGLNFMLQPSGYLSYWNGNSFVLMDSTYNVFDTITCGNGYFPDFHEFIHLKNGHSFIMSWDAQEMDLTIYGGKPNANVKGLVIQELNENKDVVFQWRSWDNFKISDAVDISLTGNSVEYVHGNALALTADGNILLSSRQLNEITKISLSTGKMIWRLGGKNNAFDFINDPEMFCRQHHVQELQNGNITLFDNGTCHDPQITKIKEYQIDTANHTAELIWSYQHPTNMYCSTMGNAQRLENGNTFINWGMIPSEDKPAITEVTPDGTIVFELDFKGVYQRIYRSFRFKWENNYIMAIPSSISKKSFNLYPNPTNDKLYIKIPEHLMNPIRLSIIDMSGRQIFYKEILPGVTEDLIYTGNLKSGFYSVRINNDFRTESQLFLKLP